MYRTGWSVWAVMMVALLSGALVAPGARSEEAVPNRDGPGEAPVAAARTFQNSIGQTLVLIPAGDFLMGSPEKQDKDFKPFAPETVVWRMIEGPQHKVRITRPFYIGATEVTRGQWKAVMGRCPGAEQADDNLPVDQVGWEDCHVFLGRLSKKEGRTYRLPTEAEWEYACRAGTTTAFSFGDDEGKLDEYAWHAKASPRDFKLQPVAQKKPNPWGLHDVHGNAWEWCYDMFSKEYEDKEQVDPTGPQIEWGDRVMRGGARFYNKPTTCNSTCRNPYKGDYRLPEVGFRVVSTSAEPVEPAGQPSDASPALTWEQRISTPEEKARLERLGAVRNSVGMVMMPIPAGEFTIGSTEAPFEQPRHKVRITKPFHIGATEVTQAQWRAVMGDNPSLLRGDDLPVDGVTWEDCQAFVKKLSEKEGKTYRLPTEAEWEYACRAGTTTRFCFGDDEAALGDYAWYAANSDWQTHPVGLKKPNAWGLYDVCGNVYEWCQDRVAPRYEGEGEQVDPTGPEKGNQRVFRGGAWYEGPFCCRSACRNGRHQSAAFSRYYFGLRVVLASEQ